MEYLKKLLIVFLTSFISSWWNEFKTYYDKKIAVCLEETGPEILRADSFLRRINVCINLS